MLSKIDIWRSAATMMKRYGPEAGLEAAKRIEDLTAAAPNELQRVSANYILRHLKIGSPPDPEKPDWLRGIIEGGKGD